MPNSQMAAGTGTDDGSIDEARKDIGLYLMDYHNWHRSHAVNDGLAPAVAEEKYNLPSGIS